MGGLVKSVFGGSSKKSTSQSTQESGNLNNSLITNALSPALGYVTSGGNALQALLGLGGDGAQAAAQANFRNTPGYQFALQGGIDAINNSQAAKGLFNSGATGRALMKYGTGLADQTYQNYISNLLGLTGIGTGAGQLIGQAGQYSKGQSTGTASGSSSSGGLGKALGFGLSLLSDRRLKKNIRETGDEMFGLPIYEFSYIWHDALHRGFMAEDVKRLYPEAVFNSGGFDRVNYGMILNA